MSLTDLITQLTTDPEHGRNGDGPDAIEEPDEPVLDDPTDDDLALEEEGAFDAPGEDSDGPTVDDLDYRIDELEADLESTRNSIRTIESTQTDVAAQLEEMNDSVRRVVGIYDRLTDDANPFTDVSTADVDGPDAARFGVVGPNTRPASSTLDVQSDADDPSETEAGEEPASASGDLTDEDAETGVENPIGDDLANPLDEAEGEDEDEDANDLSADDGSIVSFDDLVDGADRDTDRDDASGEPERASDPTPPTTDEPVTEPLLETLPEGYAAEVLVMEWLADLVDAGGPAGALKAVAYYETVDWIGPGAHDQLKRVLGGPALDVNVDPSDADELVVDDHAASYAAVVRLAEFAALDVSELVRR